MKQQSRPRVAIVGGNFAGLSAALALPRSSLAVTLIDPLDAFEWTPNVHELVSGTKAPEHLRIDRARLLRSRGHAFRLQSVETFVPDEQALLLGDGDRVAYDACIIAIGGEETRHRIAGADQHAIGFRTVDDCACIGACLARLANRSTFSVTIIGAGVSGIEALGETLRSYRRHPGLQVRLVDRATQLLPGAPAELDEDIRARCAPYPVDFHLGAQVAEVTANAVLLDDGTRLPSDLTIWAGGQTLPQRLSHAGLGADDDPRAPVLPSLQSAHSEQIFIAGDCARLARPIKRQAYHAIEMGEHAAANVRRYLRGKKLKKYRPSRKPILVALGDLDTYLVAGKRVIASPSLAGAKEALFQGGMALFAPPLKKTEAEQVYRRFHRSMTHLLAPQLGSLDEALALGRYRWVS